MGILTARHCGRDALFVAPRGMGKISADIIDNRYRLRAQAFDAYHRRRRGEGKQHEGVVAKIARRIDRFVVEIEPPGEAAFRKTSRPPKEVEPEHDGFAGVRHATACGL